MICDDTLEFDKQVQQEIELIKQDKHLRDKAVGMMCNELEKARYSYHFKWMGLPIIQMPGDIIVMQEIVYSVRPDLIIETGVARGGSIVFYASLLELLGNGGKVIGIDIDIRAHNRKRLEEHEMYKNIELIEGSSTDETTVVQIEKYIAKHNSKTVLLVLDSNHSHEHVYKELVMYAKFVHPPGYVVVFDGYGEMLGEETRGKPGGKGDNPKTAVDAFLKTTDRFIVDENIEAKIVFSSNYNGFLKCIG